METALEILARLGTDNPPSVDELRDARDTIARELHTLKGADNVDLEALMSLRDAYGVANEALTEAETAEQEAAKEIDELLDGIPNPDDEAVVEVPEVEAAAASVTGRVLPLREAVSRLGLTPRVEVKEPDKDSLADVTHTVQIGGDVRNDATFRDLAEAFGDSGRSLKTGKERVARITSTYAGERTLSGKIDENTRLIDSIVSPEAVMAAGGCCSLPTPIYDNPVLGSTARPIRDSLVTFGANRGKVTFFPAICIPQAGSGVWTCEDDAAVDPDDDSTWKDCASVECDDEDSADVDAIYRCLTVGNYTARFAPERWEGALKALMVTQARAAEVALFASMRSAVTSTHTGISTGSTYTNVVNTVALAAAAIRQDQRLDGVQLNLWVPDWLKGAIFSDLRVRSLRTGRDSIEATEALIASALASEGVRVIYSPDVDDIEAGQYDGALSPFPSTAHAVLAPEGYFTFLDGGAFDLGTEIRDHDLNRQNSVAAFAESYEGLMARGCNAKGLDLAVEICDDVPCD